MTKELTFAGIIPARYASTRFPGKPLALLGGKPVIQHVYERTSQALDNVIVATDDRRILDAVTAFGGHAVLTDADCHSGTDRVCQAMDNADVDADVIINIQGDEPFISPRQIEALKHCFAGPDTDIATLAKRYPEDGGFAGLADPNLVKVTFAADGRALYFSRSVIPYVRGVDTPIWPESAVFHTHVGIYAYRRDVLRKISALPQSTLEKAESLEQLRWLQNGYTIRVAVTDTQSIGIDTPADLAAAENYLAQHHGNA